MAPPRPTQLQLFDRPTLNVQRDVCEALNRAARESGLSREQIVDRMNLLADRYGVGLSNGKGLTLEALEKWLNPQDNSRQMPLRALPIFCAAVGDVSVLDVLARPLGARVIGESEQKRLQWAEAKLAVREQSRTIRRLEAEL